LENPGNLKSPALPAAVGLNPAAFIYLAAYDQSFTDRPGKKDGSLKMEGEGIF